MFPHYWGLGGLLLALFAVLPARADTFTKMLAPGVMLTQEIDKKTPLIVTVLTVDLTNPAVHVGVGIGQDKISGSDPSHGREDVSRYARRHGTLAAVNADFFPYTGDPLGIGIQDGELFSEPYGVGQKGGPRVALGIASDGRVLLDALDYLGDLQAGDGTRAFLNGINRNAGTNEIVLQTALFGPIASVPANGVGIVVRGANLPVRANKLVAGVVAGVISGASVFSAIPPDGFVLVAGPGSGADFLRGHVHVGERIGFVCAVAPAGETNSAVRLASLPRTANDLPARAGDAVSRKAFQWANVVSAVGGGPRLLVNGAVAVDSAAEGFDAGFAVQPNPRTAVGVSRDGKRLFLVTVDGRQPLSRGVRLTELAALLKRYGAWNAINLDGGGSTAMSVAGLTVNNPEGSGFERPVADMLTVDSDAPVIAPVQEAPPASNNGPLSPSNGGTGEGARGESASSPSRLPIIGAGGPPAGLLSLVLPAVPIAVGMQTPLHLTVGGELLSRTDPQLLWQGLVSGGVGFVSQNGYFFAMKAGAGVVTALWKGQIVTGTLTVAGSNFVPVYALHVTFAGDSMVTVRIADQAGKPLANAPVHFVVTDGVADKTDALTDADGSVSVTIIWAAGKTDSVFIQSPGLSAVTAVRPVSSAPPAGTR